MQPTRYFHATDELTNPELTSPEYRELSVRWHQFAAWTPLLRQHGRRGATDTPGGGHEYYRFGGDVTRWIAATHQLRHRLLPYMYSLAHQMHAHGGTLLRGLVFDFPHDVAARRNARTFLFGRCFLIAPVLEYDASSQRIDLPAGASWVDFDSGETVHGGSPLIAALTLERIPTYVRAGSIVPMGPGLQ
jgi:alpha-D-xyloside xylohydrolase